MNQLPQPTIERLIKYYRYLVKMAAGGEYRIISSVKFGRDIGVSAAQVRKDLSYIGGLGCRGVGYDVEVVKNILKKNLGIGKNWPIVLVGAGNLGRALVNYQEFSNLGFQIVEVFDNDLNKIGNMVNGITVKSNKQIMEVIRERNIKIAILAVPAEEAQQVADQLCRAGIQAIFNFAPIALKLRSEVCVYREDLSSGLGSLIYGLGDAG